MASRIIHTCIGKIVCSKIKLDENRFLLGNLAPDASSNKKVSHFALEERRDEKAGRYIDYDAFLDKYSKDLNDSFFLGYYCHLLSDELWYIDIYKKYITSYTEKEKNILLEKYYNDFKRTNIKLINYYNLSNDIHVIKDTMLQEINIDSLTHVIEEFKNDFSMLNSTLEETLCLLKFKDITNYIEKAAELVVNKIKSIKKNF